MAGAFELFTDRGGKIRFRLKASNGQIILASQGYKSKAAAKKGVASVIANAADETRFERRDGVGKCSFNLRAKNGQVVGTSEIYTTVRARDAGVASVAMHSAGARIVDLTTVASKGGG